VDSLDFRESYEAVNESRIFEGCNRSEDQGNTEDQLNYGLMLFKGYGIPMNKSLAAHYFKLSADQGIAQAQFNYGNMLSEGYGIPMNKSLAVHYFQLSADQGDAQAQLNYGIMLFKGDGIPMNKSLAAQYFKLSADQGNQQAQILNDIVFSGGGGIPMNELHIVESFTSSISQPQAAIGEENRSHDRKFVLTRTDNQSNQVNEEGEGFELAQSIPLLGGEGLSDLRKEADAGSGVAEFCYHLLLDELTSDL
jgi:TPR repeat protein